MYEQMFIYSSIFLFMTHFLRKILRGVFCSGGFAFVDRQVYPPKALIINDLCSSLVKIATTKDFKMI
jgi:hypothetical protein